MMLDKAEEIKNGTRKVINGKPSVYYDGYWVRTYEVRSDDFASKKKLIDALTKRVFHHVEPGINTPGFRLAQIREIYEKETDPARKRVKASMLAGALLNRGSDILSSIVDLQQAGVTIEQGNELLRQCGNCFVEALELGKNIKLANGEEGLDELWGEPFKVFSMPMEKFYESRYIKIAQTMSEIDKVTQKLKTTLDKDSLLKNAIPLVEDLGEASKRACETMRTDPVIFEVWPVYVAAKEAVEEFINKYIMDHKLTENSPKARIIYLLKEGAGLIVSLATVRVPMPKSTDNFMFKCDCL